MSTKKAKKTELPLPSFAFARIGGVVMREFRNQAPDWVTTGAFVYLEPTLWLVQKGRKRASFTNYKAARAFAGTKGKIRAFVEVNP